jgi:acetylornithine deacetylase/succinyl-diaminopimelate desuccinylase-like protein
MDLDKKLIISLVKNLALTPGKSLEESKRLELIKNFLNSNLVKFSSDDAGNIIIPVKKGRKEDTIIFDAHTDVAGKGYCENFEETETIIKGQGCADDLIAVSMLIYLAKNLKNKKLNKPFTILLSTGEEGQGNLKGIKNFISDFNGVPELFVSLDLSFNTLSFTGLGSKRFECEIFTKGGHSFEDFGNPNAIEIMCLFLNSVKNQINSVFQENPPTFNAGKINGGSSINLIADYCSGHFEFRSPSQEKLEAAEKITREILKKLENKNVKITLKDFGSRPGASSVKKNEILQKIMPVFEKNRIAPEIKPMSTNINAALSRNWPSFCTGICDCGNFHTENEYIKKDSIEKGWNLLVGLIKEFGIICGHER